ncbi:MAG: protein O-GlcNAcase, partial [Congregibacter sp.]|nr:protein O-GlcNAcase [Congregibacter sp.]
MTVKTPILGVLEGFYGRPWAPATRLLMMQWLPGLGYDAYLYAPKADAHLRKAWRQPWPPAERQHLRELGQSCALTGLSYQVGLSPFELYRSYNRTARAALKSKLGEIEDLGVSGLAILFDDMPGNVESLAARQAEICADIQHWIGGEGMALRVCPSYYSDDPVLDEIFGQRPDGYLSTLCDDLHQCYEIFWTGPAVCSDTLNGADLKNVSKECRGKLAIWDNYPVNDSRARSPHIYVGDLSGRSADISALISSHWCNAMNQPALSLPALASLPQLYRPLSEQALQTRVDVFNEAGISRELINACTP